ncbi:hypothetical protein CTZ27_18500 [Streptomyces griseocarneus]|nr:hypothetical protein CTZ27_18500 [Streptomyces griseocarneus]
MVTFAQAQERGERWANGDVPAYQHREVRVREFDLGFVVWAEDREGGPSSDGGRARLVVARDSGETTLWPGLPVGEVIRRYEEEYGTVEEPQPAPSDAPPKRLDLEATSFLLSPPQWLQDAADAMGIPDRRPESKVEKAEEKKPEEPAKPADDGEGSASAPKPSADAGSSSVSSEGRGAAYAAGASAEASRWPEASGGASAEAGVSSSWPDSDVSATPWAGADVTADADDEDRSVGLPATVLAPALSGSDEDDRPVPGVEPEAKTALMSAGSALPRTAVASSIDELEGAAPPAPQGAPVPPPQAPAAPPPPPAAPGRPGAAPVPPPGPAPQAPAAPKAGPGVPPPPGVPGAPVPPPAAPGQPPQGPGAAYAATMLADPNSTPGAPVPPPPGAPGQPPQVPGGAHHAATMLAEPGPSGAPGAPVPPPAAPGRPGAGAPVPPPAAPGQPPQAPGGVHHAATMLANGPGAPAAPAAPQGYGYPQPPAGVPLVGPGYMAVLRYRAHDGSEQQLIRRSAPGLPHPEWQILHELRAMNVPPQQVLELHTELESCDLPGGYCARMVRETWPQVRISHTAAYGREHASRQQGMRHLIEHQGELHQVADGPARPAPVRAPLSQPQQLPPVGPDVTGRELAESFGPQGVFRFEQRAVSRQGVPDVVAQTLVWAGLPMDMGPFFWGQTQPGRPVPTLAELAAERGVRPAPDAGSYLVMGSDYGRQLCVQYGTAHIVAVPLEAGPDGGSVPPQFVNTSLPQFVRSLALLGKMWRWRYGLTPEQAGRWTVDFQEQLAALDPAAVSSPENWWAVLVEQMWDGLF